MYDTLFTVLRNGLENQAVLEMAIKLIADFAQNSHLVSVILRTESATESVLNSMKSNPDSVCIQQNASVALPMLTAGEQQKRSITEKFELQYLMSNEFCHDVILCLSTHFRVPGVVVAACNVLANFAVGRTQRSYVF